MIIKNLNIKNFKSFGNNEQSIELKDEGSLILLSGKNGSGKSSIIDSFDYVFYNKVGGRKNKKTKLSSLPNRINGNLENTVEFTASNGTDVKIVRGYKPSKLELWEDGVKNERAGNSKLETLIENHIGIDYETFKSFISMSINDFKNFLSLSPEEKKLLLDKLFNLQVINDLNKILNKLISENKKDLEVIDKEIEVITDNIDNINSNIEKVKQNKKDNYTKRIEELKEKIIKGKEPLGEIKEKIETIKNKRKELVESIEKEKTTLIETRSNIKRIDEQLKLFENDKCPTCQGNLDSDFHKGLKESFEERKKSLEKIIENVTKKGSDLAARKNKLDTLLEKGVNKQNDITSDLKSMKNDYDLLLEKNNQKKDTDLDEFINTVDNLKSKLNVSQEAKSDLSDKSVYHKYLKHVFSDNGVKKTIINNIVNPINHFIHENIQQLNLPFEVTLDDKFNAQITSFGEEIDPDTLSTGENKLLSVCVLISYINLIRTKRQINVIFLDEVFSSIDVERINDVIKLLRHLADQSNINIFLIHHAVLDSNSFDKIIRVNKDIFTELEEIDVDENII